MSSEAFASYLHRQASQPDPLHVFGALFVVDAFDAYRATGWAAGVGQALGTGPSQVHFLARRGLGVDSSFDELRLLLASVVDRFLAERLVRAATVVAWLYGLQLEELERV
jgi:hypothetical protein